jgi:hypothetical protein
MFLIQHLGLVEASKQYKADEFNVGYTLKQKDNLYRHV